MVVRILTFLCLRALVGFLGKAADTSTISASFTSAILPVLEQNYKLFSLISTLPYT